MAACHSHLEFLKEWEMVSPFRIHANRPDCMQAKIIVIQNEDSMCPTDVS